MKHYSSRLKGVLFLAAYTARSTAYAQAMFRAGLEPEHVICFGSENNGLSGQSLIESDLTPHDSGKLFMPDLTLSLAQACQAYDWHYVSHPDPDVNASQRVTEIKALQPRLVIYSGYGGQRVGSDLLDLKIPMLHVHGGWLPDYRGSTTLYYSWLEGRPCGATALLLEQELDTGPIVKRREYPIPPKEVDPDYLYDPAIRADLLVDVLLTYHREGRLPPLQKQAGEGRTYYVIHPVLKHLARLKHG